MQQTRYQADLDIAASVTSVNSDLDQLSATNIALHAAKIAGQPQDELLDKRDTLLKDLTQYLDVGVTYNDDNSVGVFASAGDLLSSSEQHHLVYTPANSLQSFKGDLNLGAITIIPIDEKGNQVNGRSVVLATGGKSSAITTTLKDGKILGLMQIRDTDMPKMLAQLDSLSNGLRDAVNKISNNGVGYPPPQQLTGTRIVQGIQQVGFEGTARIAALNADGTPVASPYPDDEAGLLRPLTLDFSKIYGPTGIGKPTVTDIVKEINQYYIPANRVSMGSLADTKLVAISDNTSGPFQFDLQFENPSANPLNITIVSVDSVLSGAGVTAAPGVVTRTSPANTFTVAGPYPKSVPVVIQVTDPTTGITYNDTINYTIPPSASGARGDRYSVASLSGVNLDEELANTVLYQNAYSASARIITVVSTLFDVLLGIKQ